MSETLSTPQEFSFTGSIEEISDMVEMTTLGDLHAESQDFDVTGSEQFELGDEFLTCEDGQWRVDNVTVLPGPASSRFLYEDFLYSPVLNFNINSRLVQREVLQVPEQVVAIDRRSREATKNIERNSKRVTRIPKKKKPTVKESSQLSLFVLVSSKYVMEPDESINCYGECEKIKSRAQSQSYEVPTFSVDLPVPGDLFLDGLGGLGEDGQRRIREFTITKEGYNEEETSCPELVASVEECCCDCVVSDPAILYDCEATRKVFNKFCRNFYADEWSCSREPICDRMSVLCEGPKVQDVNLQDQSRLFKEYHGDHVYLTPEFREGVVVTVGSPVSQFEKQEIFKVSSDGAPIGENGSKRQMTLHDLKSEGTKRAYSNPGVDSVDHARSKEPPSTKRESTTSDGIPNGPVENVIPATSGSIPNGPVENVIPATSQEYDEEPMENPALVEALKKPEIYPFQDTLPPAVTFLGRYNDSLIYILGTAHFSTESQNDVRKAMSILRPDILVVELCESRAGIMLASEEQMQEESKNLTMSTVTRMVKEKGVQGLFQALLLYVSKQVTEKRGMAPGGEFRVAREEFYKLDQTSRLLSFGDRDINLTLARAIASLSLWQLVKILVQIVFEDEDISEETIEEMKKKDVIEKLIEEFTKDYPSIYRSMIEERDIYLAHVLQSVTAHPTPHKNSIVLGVVGVGHVEGIKKKFLKVTPQEVEEVLRVPPRHTSLWVTRKVLKYTFYSLAFYGAYKCLPSATQSAVSRSISSCLSSGANLFQFVQLKALKTPQA